MKKLLVGFMIAAMAMTLLVGCGSAGDSSQPSTNNGAEGKTDEEKVLNIFTWATYFPDDILKSFTEETGIAINYSNFSTNEEMLSKLETVQGGEYDIVLASDYIVKMAIDKGLVKKLDKAQIPNYDNLDPSYLGNYFDPDNEYTVPYGVGTPLIVYDPSRVDVEIKGYADLWNRALKDSLVLVNDARNILGITLKTMGKSLNEEDSAVLEEAKSKLMELKDNVRVLDYDTPYNKLLEGEATVGYMFTSQAATCLTVNPDLKVVYPEEGLGFGIDAIFTPSNAPHEKNAHAFLNYILQGEVAADIYPQILYLCPNKAAYEFLPEEYTSNSAINIPEENRKDVEFIQVISNEASDLYNSIWTEFVLAVG